MNKPWLEHYPPGIPTEIDPDEFRSVPDLLAKSVVRFAGKPAFHNLGHSLTYAELNRLSPAVWPANSRRKA